MVAEAHESINRHRTNNAALGLSILDIGVINSEHFPFNLTGYRLTKASFKPVRKPNHIIVHVMMEPTQ